MIGSIIERPMHNGRFDVIAGVDLKTYPVRLQAGRVPPRVA